MIYCIKCGSPNPDNASYCSTCGQDFVDDNHCPNCGKTLPPGAIYCSGCGSNLRELKNTAPLPNIPIYDPSREDEDFKNTGSTSAADTDTIDDTFSYEEETPSSSEKEDDSYRYSSFPDDEEEEKENQKTSSRKKTKRDLAEEYDDSYDEEEDEERGGFISRLIIILAIIIAAALLVFGFLSFSGKLGSSKKTAPVTASANASANSTAAKDSSKEETEQVEVPDLSGMTYDQAKAALDAVNLGIRASYKNSDSVEKDVIISQATAAGQKVDKNTKIHVDVSKGISITSTLAGNTEDNSGETTSQSDADQPADSSTTNQQTQNSTTANTNTASSNTSRSNANTASNADDGDLFPDIATTALSDDQLATVSDPSTCRQAINELYAREGYIFTDSSIQAYFESKSWYNGVTNDMSAIQTKIYSNGDANYNLDALVNIKNANGWSW